MSVAAIPQRTIRRKTVILWLVTLTVFLGGWGYAAKYALCDIRSKFCVMAIAGTRSEIGCQWETWSCYISTYPANEPKPTPPAGIPV